MFRKYCVYICFFISLDAISATIQDCLDDNLSLLKTYRACSVARNSVKKCEELKTAHESIECMREEKKYLKNIKNDCKREAEKIVSKCEFYIENRKLNLKNQKLQEVYAHLKQISGEKVDAYLKNNMGDMEKYSGAKTEFFNFLRLVYTNSVLKYSYYVAMFGKAHEKFYATEQAEIKVESIKEISSIKTEYIYNAITSYDELKLSTKKKLLDGSQFGIYGTLYANELDSFDILIEPTHSLISKINSTLLSMSENDYSTQNDQKRSTLLEFYQNKILMLKAQIKNKNSSDLLKQLDYYSELCEKRFDRSLCKGDLL